MYLVIPAAGVGATALVRVAMVEVAGEQAASRVGDAQCAVHEDFEFGVRHSWRISATSSSESSRDRITRVTPALRQNFTAAWFTVLACTERWMGMLRPALADHRHQPGVGHDQRIGPEVHHRRHVVEVGPELGVVRQDVADEIEPCRRAWVSAMPSARLSRCRTRCCARAGCSAAGRRRSPSRRNPARCAPSAASPPGPAARGFSLCGDRYAQIGRHRACLRQIGVVGSFAEILGQRGGFPLAQGSRRG
jgi:hypothetical protein